MKNNSYVIAVKMSVFYFLISVAWVLFSDRALNAFVNNRNLFETINTFKGILYVVITTALLFGSLVHYLSESQKANQILSESLKNQEEIKQQLKKMAYYDRMTELPNVNSLNADYHCMVKEMKKSFILMKLSLNQFNMIRELCGTSGGDNFLQTLSGRLKEVMNENEILYKMERDEFIIIIKDDPSVLSILKKTRIIMDICSISWKYNERIFYPSASVGIVKYPLQGFELEENNRGGSIDQMKTALQQKREWEKQGFMI